MQRSDAPEETPQTTSEKAAKQPKGWPVLRIVLLATFGLALFGTAGYFFLSQLAEMEQQIARLNKHVEETVQKAEEASERSETALSRAAQAEENALQAARGRVRAEQAEAEAQRKAELARQETAAATQEAELARQETERIRKLREQEMARLQRALNQIAETRRTALGLIMNLGSDSIQFDFDKANLRPENRELLSRIAGVLLTSDGYRVQVFGHTDDVGSEEYNFDLSERRAQAVHDYLIEAGIDPDILLTTKGFGKSSPLLPGTDDYSRAKNRRVEIGIIDSVIGYDGPAAQQNE